MVDWTSIIIALCGAVFGGGFWAIIKAKVDKKKTPYDMLMEMINEEKNFYKMRNEEFMREKLDSAEKSSVIAQSHKCLHRFKDPDVTCPVEDANEIRLKNRCDRCEFNPDTDDVK